MKRLQAIESAVNSRPQEQQSNRETVHPELSSFDTFSIRKIEPCHRDEVIQLCSQEFTENFPLGVAYKKKFPEADVFGYERQFWVNFLEETMGNGLCICLLDTVTDEVVGAILVSQFCKPEPEYGDSGFTRYMHAYDSMRAHLFNKASPEIQSLLLSGKVVENYNIVIHSKYKSKGLGKKMNEISMRLNMAMNYQYSLTNPSNYMSEQISRRAGAKLIAQCDITQFQMEGGVKPYEFIDEANRRVTLYLNKL